MGRDTINSTRFFILQYLEHHSIEPIPTIAMIIRSCLRCSRNSIRPLSRRRAQQGRPLRKYTTSSASAATPSSPPSSFSMLGSIISELDKLSPRFEVEPSQIRILKSPSEFYETLKVRSYSSSINGQPTIWPFLYKRFPNWTSH